MSDEIEEWVVNIGTRIDNEVISNPTESLQPLTDLNNEENPSIHGSPLSFFFVYGYDPTAALKYVAFLTRWFGLDARAYLKDIKEKEDLIWSYYSSHLRQEYCMRRNRKDFLEYVLRKSCMLVFAILTLKNVWNTIGIMSGTNKKRTDPSDQRSIEFNILYQHIMGDPISLKLNMLTMEYQISWFLAEAVYTKHSNLSKLVGTPIDVLTISCFDDLYPGVHKSKVQGGTGTLSAPQGGFKHLLHIFHWSRTPEGKYLVETRSLQPIKKMDNFYIPSATDLKLSATVFEKHAAGIHLSYYDKRLSGVMQIAPLHIFYYSHQIYKSLLEFERGYVDCGFPVTAYVACMVKLLQTKADVRLLQANGVVPSTGNDEKEVLSFVQDFKTLLHDDFRMPNDLDILSEKVRAHHERSSSRSYAEFKSRYFANTWITISVIAGILLFVLTFIQTLYGTLSYYKQ